MQLEWTRFADRTISGGEKKTLLQKEKGGNRTARRCAVGNSASEPILVEGEGKVPPLLKRGRRKVRPQREKKKKYDPTMKSRKEKRKKSLSLHRHEEGRDEHL